jgi:hypothetical protein
VAALTPATCCHAAAERVGVCHIKQPILKACCSRQGESETGRVRLRGGGAVLKAAKCRSFL